MMFRPGIRVFLGLVVIASHQALGLPLSNSTHFSPEENRDVTGLCLEEGDILVKCKDQKELPQSRSIKTRSLLEENIDVGGPCLKEGDVLCHLNELFRMAPFDKYLLWTTRQIPYVIDPSYEPEFREQIRLAMDDIEKVSCIHFAEKKDEDVDYLRIREQRGCYSYIGRKGGQQLLSLAKRCFTLARGILIHELLHAAGLMHEHTRPDRDDYITIYPNNIIPSQLQNFEKRPVYLVDTLDLPYDYTSIMHYGTHDFALDPSQPTIMPKDPEAVDVIGQREYISDLDAKKLNKLYMCDIQECDDPGAPEAGSRIGDDFSVGSVVIYECEEGRRLVGYPKSFCRYDGQWTGFLPRCIAQEIVEICDFEDGMCGWAQDIENDLSWVRLQGSAYQEYTGPHVDHTLETSEGHSLYLSSMYARSGQKSKIITPTFKSQTGKVCLRLAYYMWGQTMGTLNVYVRFHHTEDVLLWSKSGNQGPHWKTLKLAISTTDFIQIAIEGIIGSDSSDMAIDDFLLRDCPQDEYEQIDNVDVEVPTPPPPEEAPLPVDFHCNFEDGLCMFADDENADFRWLLNSGPTSTLRTGPSVDRTLRTMEGSYLYTEASFPRKPGEVSAIISPSLEDSTIPHCLQFYYHMYGEHMGTLNVYVQHGDPSTRSLMWKDTGNLGDLWRKKQIIIPPTKGDLKIVFEGIIGDGIRSDIAIDDITLMNGLCPN